MDELKPKSEHPDFTSLTEIMERFRTVPYEQFQQELEEWFTRSLAAQGRDADDLAALGFPNLPQLISKIYHQAEVMQTLSENGIEPHEDNK
ncbi:hypothetical protein [Mucilaginibacter defluvii]|uniref:Uncharacterized protein n=1 Tax=Mucilaginibacter defluvii TaxID=1196019 RepID=A0ABP9FPH9_9SPHI|nr:hypothetical protein [Bacteroidota bacterium]